VDRTDLARLHTPSKASAGDFVRDIHEYDGDPLKLLRRWSDHPSMACVVEVDASNQFMSKTSRNLTENPRASLLLIDPVSYSEYRLTIRYERTDRRGPVFERLRDDVDKVAAMSGMRDIFRLRSAEHLPG